MTNTRVGIFISQQIIESSASGLRDS